MQRVVMLRGVPGSGKSTEAHRLFTEQGLIGWTVLTFSADDYFMRDGVYQFDWKKLGDAHGTCLRGFVMNLVSGRTSPFDEVLVVDNTNLTMQELLPYVQLSKAFKVPFEIVTVMCDPALAAARNVHGVPLAKVYEMDKRMQDSRLPRDWPQRTIQAEIWSK